MEIELSVYAVRNSKGQFFRAKGYSGGGDTWVNDINKAKIYPKTGGARGTITWFANNFPEYPTPELIKLTVTKIEVMDETKRVAKVIENKKKEELRQKQARAERELKDAQSRYDKAQADLKKLKGN